MTVAQRHLFLQELAVTGNLSFALHAASLSRREAYTARDRHPGFERDWRLAEQSARARFRSREATRHPLMFR